MKKHLSVILLVALILLGVFLFGRPSTVTAPSKKAPATTVKSQPVPKPTPTGFNKTLYSTTDPTSLWVIVNKQHPLNPKTYAPTDLVIPNIPLRSNITSTESYVRADMAKALETMVPAAKTDGVYLNLQSGYRSYPFQVSLYNRYVAQQGQAVADTQSARAGYSEHQTGWAADLGGTTTPSCDVEDCYATTPEGKWLAANAYRYGFLIRYPADKQAITGYKYEPWHIRYIGVPLATELHTKGIETLEEFFNVTGGESY